MKQQNEIVKKVLNYIEDNIEKEINVDKIARSVGYSKFYFSIVFPILSKLMNNHHIVITIKRHNIGIVNPFMISWRRDNHYESWSFILSI